MSIHETLAQGRWQTLTLAEQLANAGSEFSRALRARQNHNEDRFRNAFDRMHELLSLTACDPRRTPSQRREVTRLRENIGEGFFGDPPSVDSLLGLERYFTYFGIESRSKRMTFLTV